MSGTIESKVVNSTTGGGGGGGITSINSDTNAAQTIVGGTGISVSTSSGATTVSASTGNLTDAGTDGIIVTGGAGAVIGSGTSLAQHVADSTHNGYLSSTDWSTFNGKQSTITTGNLTDVGTDGIVVAGGTGAVIGSGASLAQHVSDSTHNGYLSSTDWSTFNGKQAAGNYITDLTTDVTASGPGSVAATIATGAVTDTKGSLANKPAIAVVATTNQTLSGTPTIDGVATAANTMILLTGQTSGSENGPWTAQSGAWTRPTWYPSGGTTQAFQFITTLVRLGTTYQGTTWRMTTSGAITIDTTATTWVVTPLAINASTLSGVLPVANGGTNSSTSLSNNRFIVSSSSKIVEAGAVTANNVVGADANGLPASTTTTVSALNTAFGNQTANTVWAGPTSGSAAAPAFRSTVIADYIPFVIYGMGDGSDGAFSASSGTTTLTRAMFWSSVTLTGTGKIATSGFPIYCTGNFDMSNAGAAAINSNANNATNGAAGGTAGNAGAVVSSAVALGAGVAGGAGGAGSTTNAGNGVGGTAPIGNGGIGAASGAGGAGSGGTAGTNQAQKTPTTYPVRKFDTTLLRGVSLLAGGASGNGGGGGGGDAITSGGGGGGGGGAAPVIAIYTSIFTRGASTAVGTIQCIGGNGGNGGSPASGNTGGGGAGGGGGGGWVYIAAGSFAGATGTSMVDVTGGNGGAGGTAQGTGVGGNGGGAGSGGRVTVINLNAGTSTDTTFANQTTGNAHSGTTGGTATTATTSQVSV